jgi:hypothetical protein
MELAKLVTVTLLFFIAVVLLTSGRAFSADDLLRKDRQRAVLADEAEELRKFDAQEARRNAAVAAPARGIPRRNFERLCVIKPVMADREIEACRISYQRKDI